MSPISVYDSERWLQLADELNGQARRLMDSGLRTKVEWEAMEDVTAAARRLFSAFAHITAEREKVA